MDNNEIIRRIEEIAASNKDKQQKTEDLSHLRRQIKNSVTDFDNTMAKQIQTLHNNGASKIDGKTFLENIEKEINSRKK